MIIVKNFTKGFDKRIILDDISLSFPDSSMIGLIGESGSGKTTLLRCISLLDTKYEGSILVDNENLSEMKKKEKEKFCHRNFSFIFSDAHLLNYLSPKENAFLPALIQGKSVDIKRFDEYIADLKLDLILSNKLETLSAGEKQRVSILRALLMNQKYIIADEPTAHLDPLNAKQIISLLSSIAHKYQKTIVVALHDYSNLSLFDQVFKIENQKVHRYAD